MDFEDCSKALGQLSAVLSLWGYTKTAAPIQNYLKAKGVRAVADLSHAQIKALACMLEVSWQRQPEAFKIERLRLQEWLRVLNLTLTSPPISSWLQRRHLSPDNIPMESLRALNTILKAEFEQVQVARVAHWEQQHYGFSLNS